MNKNQVIAVIGGTGKAGKYIIDELLAREFTVKALLRNPEKLKTNHQLLVKVKGDVRENGDLDNLLEGCDILISALGQPKNESAVFQIAATNIIEAMNQRNMKRYIAITGLSIDLPTDRKSFRTKLLSWIMRVSFPSVIKDKQEEYTLMEKSNLEWTLYRLPMIEVSDVKKEVIVNEKDCTGKKITTASLAEYIVIHLNEKEMIGKAPFLYHKE